MRHLEHGRRFPSYLHVGFAMGLGVMLALGLGGCGASEGGNGPNGADTKQDSGNYPDGQQPDVIGGPDTKAGPDTFAPPKPDDDGDGIANSDEGDGAVDTDGDGVPDSADADSDGDGISDEIEAGDADTNTPPVDTDGDGMPDFQDLDSDGNGINDDVEGLGDSDGDGVLDFVDTDNDGDGIHDGLEIAGGAGDCNRDGLPDPAGTPANPWDCNADGTPDYATTDADGDGISDRIEGLANDTDNDGFLDRYDLDSDGDGISDATEAGGTNPQTPPVDSDQDGIADFRDIDSDNDGVTDADELVFGTNPTNGDTDNDGASDLIETVAGTNPLNGSDNPQSHGDFVFLIPYQDTTTPTDDTLEFATAIQFADLYFGFDETGSMSGELAAMANATNGVPSIISQLRCAESGGLCSTDADCGANVCFNGKCITNPSAGAGCIPDMWTGVATFNNVNTFKNIVSVQSNPAVTSANIPSTGGGGSEAVFQPSYCVANRGSGCAGCASGGVGCGGMRQEAIRIYIQISDANNQCSNCGSFTSTGAGTALKNAGIKFIGLYGTDDSTGASNLPQLDAEAIGRASGTVNSSGNPFVYPAINSAVVGQTVQAVRDIARGVPLNVTIDAQEIAGDDGDALRFIDYLEVNISGTGNCTVVSPVLDTNNDSHADAFPSLLPGTPVCWNVIPVFKNLVQQPKATPQLFKARLTVYGDGSPLDSRDVFFLLPPDINQTMN